MTTQLTPTVDLLDIPQPWILPLEGFPHLMREGLVLTAVKPLVAHAPRAKGYSTPVPANAPVGATCIVVEMETGFAERDAIVFVRSPGLNEIRRVPVGEFDRIALDLRHPASEDALLRWLGLRDLSVDRDFEMSDEIEVNAERLDYSNGVPSLFLVDASEAEERGGAHLPAIARFIYAPKDVARAGCLGLVARYLRAQRARYHVLEF